MNNIESLILLAEENDNTTVHFDLKKIYKKSTYSFICTEFMIDIYSQIERWDLSVSKVFAHPIMRDTIFDNIELKCYDLIDNHITLWGSPIIFNTETPSDTIVAVSDLYKEYRNGVSIGKVDVNKFNRLNKLKAFW